MTGNGYDKKVTFTDPTSNVKPVRIIYERLHRKAGKDFLRLREERSVDRAATKQIKIYGYPMADLESERRAASQIKTRRTRRASGTISILR